MLDRRTLESLDERAINEYAAATAVYRLPGGNMRLVYFSLVVIFLAGCGSSGGGEAGTEGGPCYPNGTCNSGLECLSNLCVNLWNTLDVVDTVETPDDSLQQSDAKSPDIASDNQPIEDDGGLSDLELPDTSAKDDGDNLSSEEGDIASDTDVGPETCEPSCVSKECGDDGCGNVCGSCGTNEKCGLDGQCSCVADSVECKNVCCDVGQVCFEEACCTSDCIDKVCGDDGCGGSCGGCEDQFQCQDGTCVYQPDCGNTTCDTDLDEDCESCPLDCGCMDGDVCSLLSKTAFLGQPLHG